MIRSLRRIVALNVLLAATSLVCVPAARAEMPLGNYDFNTDWDATHHWVWSLRTCDVSGAMSCLHITAVPRPSGGAAPYAGIVHADGNRYTLLADLPTGLVCIGSGLPTHNVYSWDPLTLAGTVNSAFDVGCGGGPGGAITYAFTLARL